MSNPFRSFPNGNGNNIPILGQAFTVKSGFSTVLIQCGCEAKEPILIVGGAHGICPSCQRVFACVSFTADNQTGQIHAKVGVGHASAPEPEPAGVAS